jgi:transposase-like protein
MSEPNNGQALSAQNSEAAQGFTAERVLRTRPKTYRAIVQLLAEPHASVNQIAKVHRVSTHTVRAIRYREAQGIAERKKTLAAMLANVAELGAYGGNNRQGQLARCSDRNRDRCGQDACVDGSNTGVADSEHRHADRG